MKVAIIGAGLAGLSCAHELERYGIRSTLYERNSYIGDQIAHVSALLEIINRPIKDVLGYMDDEYGIKVKPLNILKSLTHSSPNKTTIVRGNLGYFISRGSDEDSLAHQIFSQLKNTELNLSMMPDIDYLSKQNDFVIVANGNSIYPETFGCWQSWLNTYLRGAIVLGKFDPHELKVWVNKKYCNRGYAYLTPFNNKKASLILIASDVNVKEIDHCWELFLATENIKYSRVEEFRVEHKSGFVYPLSVGNILFAGNAGGAIDPFLGFGQYNSITMGVMAARSIIYRKSYETLVQDIIQKNLNLLQFRKVYDLLDNRGYDFLISAIGLPGLKHVAYYTPVNVVKMMSTLFKIIPTKLK